MLRVLKSISREMNCYILRPPISIDRKDASMKTMLLALATLIFLPLFFTLGQERIDVIHLKNGDIIKGIIIESIPNDYVKIELSGGSVFTVKYADILQIDKEKPSTDSQLQQQSRHPESIGQPDLQKIMTYEREKKNSGTAIALSILLTSLAMPTQVIGIGVCSSLRLESAEQSLP